MRVRESERDCCESVESVWRVHCSKAVIDERNKFIDFDCGPSVECWTLLSRASSRCYPLALHRCPSPLYLVIWFYGGESSLTLKAVHSSFAFSVQFTLFSLFGALKFSPTNNESRFESAIQCCSAKTRLTRCQALDRCWADGEPNASHTSHTTSHYEPPARLRPESTTCFRNLPNSLNSLNIWSACHTRTFITKVTTARESAKSIACDQHKTPPLCKAMKSQNSTFHQRVFSCLSRYRHVHCYLSQLSVLTEAVVETEARSAVPLFHQLLPKTVSWSLTVTPLMALMTVYKS